MGGSIRSARVTLTSLVLVAGYGLIRPPVGWGADPDQPPASGSRGAAELAAFFRQPGDDPPRPSVPLRPATVEDRRRTEAVRLYSAARALEDQRRWSDAVALLQQAAKLDPDSLAIPRRLSRIYLGALGRPDLALPYGRRVLALDPDDTETLARLVDFFTRRGDAAGAEALLAEVLANPKLGAHSPGRLLAEFERGKLYSTRLRQLDKAAEAFAKVIEALDDKSANRFSPAVLARVLGQDPATAYLNFGLTFLAAHREDLAIKAFERGLVYDADNPQLALDLAETLFRQHQPGRALGLVERAIRLQPQGVEAYELLAKVLTALHREAEITPRLEEAARRDSQNVPLQYVLADRYRETGQVEKAEALYKALLSSQPTPQTYRALAASLLKRKKAADLLKVFCEALNREATQQAIRPQILAAAADDAMAEALLDAGLRGLSEHPPALPPRTAFPLLMAIATNPGKATTNKVRRLEKLLKILRLQLEQSPSPLAYAELADCQRRLGHYAEAAAAIEQMIARYPREKSVRTLAALADDHRRAGHIEAAQATLREARKLGPTDSESQLLLAQVLSRAGRLDDAIGILQDLSKREPNNPVYDLTLGSLLMTYGRNEAAIKLFEDLIKRYGDNDEIVRMARSSLSVIYVNMGNYSKGEAELELLLQRNPDEAQPNNDLGYLYAEQGKNLEKAEAMIRKALQDEPENYAYLDSMGWVLFKLGKVKEALEAMLKAVEQMKADVEQKGINPDATIYEHLGDVYFQLQEIDKAADAWREALKAGEQAIPPERRLGEIRKKLDALRKLGPAPKTSSYRTP